MKNIDINDIGAIEKNIMYLTMGLKGDYGYFENMPIDELIETIEMYVEVLEERGK